MGLHELKNNSGRTVLYVMRHKTGLFGITGLNGYGECNVAYAELNTFLLLPEVPMLAVYRRKCDDIVIWLERTGPELNATACLRYKSRSVIRIPLNEQEPGSVSAFRLKVLNLTEEK